MKTLTQFIKEEQNDAKIYKVKFEEFVSELKDGLSNISEIKNISGRFAGFCPNVQFIRVDFLDKKDWPNNIAENSKFIDFKIDFYTGRIEAWRDGYIWLSKPDQDKSYLVMNSMENYTKAYSTAVKKISWLRAFTMKDNKSAIKKIKKFIEEQVEVLNWATGGYPYKRAIVDIY